MKRVWITAAACLTVLFLWLSPVSVRAEGITMDAEVGFDGTYLTGSWTPIRVVLENTGSDFQGSLQIAVNIGQGSEVIYSAPVNLPNTSEKEYTLFARIPGTQRSLNINLTDQKGQVSSIRSARVLQTLKVNELKAVDTDHYLLGLVTDDQPSLGYWKEKLAGNQLLSNYQPVALDASNFPDRIEVLSAFSVLIINHFDSDSFRPQQLDNLNVWLNKGGILIVGAGVNGRRTLSALTDSILPVSPGELKVWDSRVILEDFTGKEILSDTSLQIMSFPALDDKAVLGNEEGGLIWAFQKGLGTIYLSAFDLGTEPILSWTGNKLLWDNLLTHTLNPVSVNQLRYPYEKNQDTRNLEEVLGMIEAMEMPSAALILFLFLFYLALAGPLNYLFLKKIDKREWSWATIPALSVLFALLIFVLGYNTKGGELLTNTISVVDLPANTEYAELTNHVGVFMPRRGDYTVEIDRFALLTPGDLINVSYQGNTAEYVHAHLVQGSPSQILYDNVNIWTMKTFQTDTRRIEFGSLQSDLYYEMGTVKGTVQNNTDYPLERLVIYTPFAFVEVGNIAAGESKNVEMTLPLTSQSWYNNNLYSMIDSVFPWPSGVKAGNQESRRTMARRRMLERLITQEYEYARSSSAAYPAQPGQEEIQSLNLSYFAFYQGQPESGLRINGKQPDRILNDGMIMGNMDLNVEREGMVSIPPGMLTGRLENSLSRNFEDGREMIYVHGSDGFAVFSVDLSPYVHLQDLKVQIGMSILHGSGTIQILDLEHGDYLDVTGLHISIDQSSLSRYLDVDNMIYLKVLPGYDQYVEVGLPAITLEGREP